MFNKCFLSHNLVLGFITTKSTAPKSESLFQFQNFSLPISLRYCTTTTTTTTTTTASESESDTLPFAVSYLINNFGFSHESALRAFNNKQVRFNTIEKPNSVINFFKNHEFSHSNIRTIIKKEPWLLSSKPHNVILPKFQFFLSKGASSSDIVSLLTAYPRILQSSLVKRIIPIFELLSKFLKTNKDTIVCLIRNWPSFVDYPYDRIAANINLLRDFGVCDSGIARLILTGPSILGSTDLINTLEEVKGLGFDPSTSTFVIALVAKKCMIKKLWDEKVDAFKKWGWSDEDIMEAFRKHPHFMFTSIDKINLLMGFWVNQLGWDATAIAKLPKIFGSSLERRIIPRATVVQYLLKKGLLRKKASLTAPFVVSDKLFLDKYINCYKEESSYLLKLYAETLKLAQTKDKTDQMS
ncbi:unnamed protein product [Trifolium pratense]|uniref:Uncharacterized protein n=1 Tax=Trifolium pratense TaxID=57577 RepID=A0ACB0L0M1_TRIPR|nr:unnamed protein product [Trifolium pratense]